MNQCEQGTALADIVRHRSILEDYIAELQKETNIGEFWLFSIGSVNTMFIWSDFKLTAVNTEYDSENPTIANVICQEALYGEHQCKKL